MKQASSRGKVRQQYHAVERADGAYYNFFFTPGSFQSLAWFVDHGWALAFIKDDPETQRAVAIFEIEEKIL